MSTELTLETLAKDITDLKTLAAGIKVGMEEDDKKKLEAKKAEDEKMEDEKKEAKKASRTAALKLAMEEKDEEKRDAAIKLAMEDDEHKADHEEHDKNMDKHNATDEEKEKDAQIASIILDKKNSLIAQILTANRLINPTGLEAIEARLKKASITEIQNEYNIVKPFIAGAEPTVQTPQQKIIPFFANITPKDIDNSTLTASSPDSDFAKLSTQELLEGTQ